MTAISTSETIHRCPL